MVTGPAPFFAGKLVADSRTNSLIITDIPSRFPIIEKAIAELDVKTQQILISAEILEKNRIWVKKNWRRWLHPFGVVTVNPIVYVCSAGEGTAAMEFIM